MKKTILAIFCLGAILTSCKKAAERQLDEDIEKIEKYLEENNLTAQCTSSGLYYIIDEPGTGERPELSSSVTVVYRGYHPSGSVFDESDEDGIQFTLSNVIEGWQEGIPLFKEGGSGSLFIPSSLAYGKNGSGSIGGDAVIFFDIELLAVE